MEPVVLETEVTWLVLRAHLPDDAQVLEIVLNLNSGHLMASGDYTAEIAATADEWRQAFEAYGDGREPAHSFGAWIGDEMVGRMVLVPVEPPRYGIGYRVTESQQGKGIATAAVRAIVGDARSIGASVVFAGVNHGSDASRRVLTGCGFEKSADFDFYTRFRRDVSERLASTHLTHPHQIAAKTLSALKKAATNAAW